MDTQCSEDSWETGFIRVVVDLSLTLILRALSVALGAMILIVVVAVSLKPGTTTGSSIVRVVIIEVIVPLSLERTIATTAAPPIVPEVVVVVIMWATTPAVVGKPLALMQVPLFPRPIVDKFR